ncbi:MAG TPA: hypothetical protein VFU21_03515 [Kofleriaceae bacterium]|nr:hypothetical protein [Kofleriaceae bacterium]
MRSIQLASLALLAGCYRPDLADGLPCSPEGDCPDGQTCAADGNCYRDPPPVGDAGVDARADRLIDPAVRITDTPGRSDAPSLVWTGSEYGIAWVDDRGGNDEIFFARVAPDGALVGEAVRVTDSPGEGRDPSLVWTGEEYAVAWVDDLEGNFEVYLARLSASGELAAGPLRVTDDPEFSGSPSLVWTGSELVVAWNDGRDGNFEIYLARLDPDGTKIGGDLRFTTDGSFSATPSLAWTGDELAIGWADDRDGNNEIYFGRADAAGARVGTDVRVTDQMGYSSSPQVAVAGDARPVAWLDLRDPDRELYFARLTAAGASETGDVRLSDLAAATGSATSAAVAWTGDELGVAYATDGDAGSDVLLTRRDLAGAAVGGDVPVADGPESAVEVALVWSGTVYAVAWADDRDGNAEIYLRELAP